jgi:hypothetical protein
MTIRAFYKRYPDRVDGLFTLHEYDDKGRVISAHSIVRVAARSGQAEHTRTDWHRGKSPIPYGDHLLFTASLKRGQWSDTDGIGEFFPISNDVGDRHTITGPAGQMRKHIGLHPENQWPGSAGCIVIVRRDDWARITDKLHALNQAFLRLTVL